MLFVDDLLSFPPHPIGGGDRNYNSDRHDAWWWWWGAGPQRQLQQPDLHQEALTYAAFGLGIHPFAS